MSEKREFELFIDRGFGEKTIQITDSFIDLDPSAETSLWKIHKPELLVFGCNGEPAPFEKGSAVLKGIRKSIARPLTDWKVILELHDDPAKTFSILDIPGVEHSDNTNHWGIWVHKTDDPALYPDLILINYPIHLINYKLKKSNLPSDEIVTLLPEVLSKLYRSLLAAIDAYLMFHLGTLKIRTILMSDIGSIMLKDSSLDGRSSRITIFSQVIGSWIGIHPEMEKIIIAYGGGHRAGELQQQIEHWAEQEKAGAGEEAELVNAGELRQDNSRICRQIYEVLPTIPEFDHLRSCLNTSAEIFSVGNPILATDALQSRKLTEALTKELTEMYLPKSNDKTLDSYIRRLEETKKISPWMTSYMHVIRILGNEAAHYNKEQQKRPERPAGKDLTVIHAALGRVLTFCLSEFKSK